jgi:hypothetical protein
MYILLILHLFICVHSQGMYNYTSGIALPLICPSDSFAVTQTGAFIDVPVGATGVQIRQIVFGHRAAAPPMLANVSIIGNGITGEVDFTTTSQLCCTSTECDLASYAIYSSGSWFDTPTCGQQSLCGPPVQWYSLSFENTPAGTCFGCGMYGTGIIDMTIDFQGNIVTIPDYGTGGTMYVSYYGIFPVSPTPSPSESASISESMSISPSESGTPSETASISESMSISPSNAPSISETVSISASMTLSSTETPSPVSPSMSPSISPSISVSKSVTASRSPSHSPVGVCNHAQAMLYGTYEWVIGPSGSLYYYILHGTNVSHIYSPSYMLMGKNPTCTETTTTCTCTYTQGDSAVCSYPRQSTITYSYGTETKTTFTQQNPACIYYFSTTLNIISPTPSSSISPSISPSVTPSASPIDGVVELIADSTADFQPIQGNNGWYYNYYNDSMMINPFPNFGPNPLNVPNNWLISGSYCRINMNAIHGNSPYDCNSPSYGWCYPSLYWLNMNYSYKHFIVNVKASHTLYTPPGIDGVKLNISINNNQIDSYQTPFTVNKNYTATNITDVEVVLDPIHGCFSDKTDQNVKIYAYKPVMFSPTPSGSPSVSITKSHSPSKSASPSFSSSQTNSLTATPSITGSITSTPLFFVTAWPTLSSTLTRTATESPAFMMTPWPTRGFTSTRTSTPKMYMVYYPSASSSQLPMGIQAELEESDKKDSTAKIVGGVAVGAGALTLGGAIFIMVQSARAPSPEDTTKAPDDNSNENSKRNLQDDNSEDSTKRTSLQYNTEDSTKRASYYDTVDNSIDDTTQRKNTIEDDEQITPRPSIRQHIEYIDSHNSSPVTVKITSILDTGILLRDNTRGNKNKDASDNNTKEGPDYEPLISYFYYKKLQEHIQESAENNNKIK